MRKSKQRKQEKARLRRYNRNRPVGNRRKQKAREKLEKLKLTN